jgi:hypothetical protein
MATYAHLNTIPGLVAGGNLASSQYKVVKFASTANAVVAVTATTSLAIGILQNDPASGEPAIVAGPGSIATALAGATDIAVGELLGFNSTGQVADHTTDGRYMLCQALQASTALNDEIKVFVIGLFGYS